MEEKIISVDDIAKIQERDPRRHSTLQGASVKPNFDLSVVELIVNGEEVLLTVKQARDLALQIRTAGNQIERSKVVAGWKPSKHAKGRK